MHDRHLAISGLVGGSSEERLNNGKIPVVCPNSGMALGKIWLGHSLLFTGRITSSTAQGGGGSFKDMTL